MTSSRRRFLRNGLAATGVGLGAGALGAGAWFATHQPKKRWLPLPADNHTKPLYPSAKKRVVVIGAGIAGLVTAMELAARRFDVTLVERAGHLGGKLGGWKLNILGETFSGEHGFHGFFGQYYNLYEVLAAAGAEQNLTPPPDYPIRFADGSEDTYRQITRTFPLNLLSVVHQSKGMSLRDFATDGSALYDLMRYRGGETFEAHDDVDFWKFTKDGRINQPMRERVIHPFARTSLNAPEALSAAQGISFFHFFFIGNPEGLWYRYTKNDCMTSIIGPFEKRLRSYGTTIAVGTGAKRLRHENGRITGVELEGQAPDVGTVRIKANTITDNWSAIAGPDGSAVYITRRKKEYVALDARCTHMGCPVRHLVSGFECPCHGGRFDENGEVTQGPPEKPLRRLPVVAQGDELVIGETATETMSVIPCDYAVSACEVRGTRELFKKSELGVPELERKVLALAEADPYIVYRLWLDRAPSPSRTAFYSVAGYRLVDSLAIYTQLQEEYVAWGKRTGGSVIELHSYAVTHDRIAGSNEMAAIMIDEMRRILPELAEAKVLHGEFAMQSNFSGFAPGSHRARPRTETEVSNLFLAGDHVRMDASVALMEAATMSGRLAANAVLRKEGLREVEIAAVPDHGPLT